MQGVESLPKELEKEGERCQSSFQDTLSESEDEEREKQQREKEAEALEEVGRQ